MTTSTNHTAPVDLDGERVARIVEPDCIGCARCIQVCPVDAIVGAAGRMHTVVSSWCSGCDLCVPVCPTDCIEMVPAVSLPANRAAVTAVRTAARVARRMRDRAARVPPLVDASAASQAELRAAVLAAVLRRRSGTA
jgi:Na+-translocating ferredoxin:NAD+ oxidoreductase subunit B